jgi:hypothetical protein
MYVDMSSENEKSPRAKRTKAGTGTVERLQKDSEAIQKNPPRPRKNEMPAETVVNPAAPVPVKKRNSVSRFENIVIFAYTSRPKIKPGQVTWQQSVFLFILNFPRASSQQTQRQSFVQERPLPNTSFVIPDQSRKATPGSPPPNHRNKRKDRVDVS